jgi:membrane protease YdiL (CAAX protease family)
MAHLFAHPLSIAAILLLVLRHGKLGRRAFGLGLGRLPWLGVALYPLFLAAWVPLVFVLYAGLLRAIGTGVPEQQVAAFLLQSTGDPRFVWFLVVIAVGGPVAEELFFRGLLLPWLVGRLGTWPALLAVSLLFGLVHEPAFYMLLPLGLIGLFLGWLRLVTGSVLVPLVVHVLHNSLTIAVYLTWPGVYEWAFGR